MPTGMTKNQRQCQNGWKYGGDQICRICLSNNTLPPKADKRDSWVPQPIKSSLLGSNKTALLRPLNPLQLKWNTTNLFSGPMCQATLSKDCISGQRQRQGQSGTLHHAPHRPPQNKLTCLSILLLIENLTAFPVFDSIQPVHNLVFSQY